MLFSSVTFLFLFLPLTIIIYYLVPRKFRNWVLLLASIIFYAWGELRFLLLMFITILANYIGALLISNINKYKKIFLALTILINVGLLSYFKYVDFLIECFNNIFKTNHSILYIALPLGISFYIFQAISYTVDVYRAEINPQKNFFKLALYISLFPQLIAGPIIKYHDIADQIDNRKESLELFYSGLRRFIIGLSRKVLIANTLGIVVDKILATPLEAVTSWESWLGVICYAFQIYNDFGGYADMAIGLCAMFGFVIQENFNFPFLSLSYSEFWHRWHISLGTWVKEYIYIPLGGNRCHPLRHYFNLFLSFFIIGVWHGATANMIGLGIYNAVLVVIEKLTGWSNRPDNKIMVIVHHIYMIPVLAISYFLLRSPDFIYTMHYLPKLIGIGAPEKSIFLPQYYIGSADIIILVIAFLGSIGVFKNFLKVSERSFAHNVCKDILLFLMLILSLSAVAESTYNPFIYFRF